MNPKPWHYNADRSRGWGPVGQRFACFRRRQGKFKFVGFVASKEDVDRYLNGAVVKFMAVERDQNVPRRTGDRAT